MAQFFFNLFNFIYYAKASTLIVAISLLFANTNNVASFNSASWINEVNYLQANWNLSESEESTT
jgi:hypothetical protein